MRRLRPFDFAGIVSVIIFVAVVGADLDALRFIGAETAAAVNPEELRAGFREGVAWYGFYLKEVKFGFSRIERRRVDNGHVIRVHSLMRPMVFGRPTTVDLHFEAVLDRDMALTAIDLAVDSGSTHFTAAGEVRDGRLEMVLRGAGMEHRTGIDLESSPALDLTVWPAFLAAKPEKGSRTTYQTFDPSTLGMKTIEIEYLGRDTIEILGDRLPAHVLLQRSETHSVRVWVNDLGEVLQEEMPLDIVALREAEADATWGLGRGASLPTAEIGGLGELLTLIGPLTAPELPKLGDKNQETTP